MGCAWPQAGAFPCFTRSSITSISRVSSLPTTPNFLFNSFCKASAEPRAGWQCSHTCPAAVQLRELSGPDSCKSRSYDVSDRSPDSQIPAIGASQLSLSGNMVGTIMTCGGTFSNTRVSKVSNLPGIMPVLLNFFDRDGGGSGGEQHAGTDDDGSFCFGPGHNFNVVLMRVSIEPLPAAPFKARWPRFSTQLRRRGLHGMSPNRSEQRAVETWTPRRTK